MVNEDRTPISRPKPPRPIDDAERVQELHDLKILDTAPEARFDRLTRKLADEMGVPAAYIALIDDERQWIKSKVGHMPTEIERDQSFCTYTIAGDRPLVVPDAAADSRFAGNPLVTGEAGIRFYAGVPVAGPNGHHVGTVCITDDKPREINNAELAALKDHALTVQEELNALPTVFISYAHEDETWKDRLVVHCSTLQRKGLLEIWNDREIGTGEDWADKIRDAMERAKVAVLLVSADFLASDFIHRDEVPRLLERRDAEGLVVLPLLLKPCTWDEVQWLARMNLRPRDGHPLCAGREFEVDEQLARFASELGTTIRRLGRKVASVEERRRRASDRAPGSRQERSEGAAPADRPAPGPAAGGPGGVRVGSFLGGYEILSKLGSGGMGEVFMAQDSKLKRIVALKVLKTQFALDPVRLARFQREAEAAAGLNHPNIVTLFSVEEDRGVHFFTMELVEGKRLDQVIPPGGLKLDTFFNVALRLIDAVACAHRGRIVHRDLKAANVMVTGEGRVKVLDFGLAKLLDESDASKGSGVRSLDSLSVEGLVVGTVPYMSPEQVSGKPVDDRTDIFSLGVLLYEMVIGRRPFEGDSSTALAAAILRDTPRPVTELRSGLPNHLGRILRRCLEKEPERRYQSALDLLNELEGLRAEVAAAGSPRTGTGSKPAPPPPHEVRPKRVPLLVASILAASVLVVGGLWALRGGLGFQGTEREVGSTSAAPETDGATPQRLDHRSPAAAEPPTTGAGEAAVADTRDRRPEVDEPAETRRGLAAPARLVESTPQLLPAAGPPDPHPGPEAATPVDQDSTARVQESPAPPTTAEPETQRPQPGEDQAILGTLEGYAAAMRSLDAAAVARVRSDVDLEKLSEQFAMVQSQKFDLEDCAVRIEGGTMASVACRERVEVVPKRGINPPPMDHVIVFELHKQDGSWLIVGRSLGSH